MKTCSTCASFDSQTEACTYGDSFYAQRSAPTYHCPNWAPRIEETPSSNNVLPGDCLGDAGGGNLG